MAEQKKPANGRRKAKPAPAEETPAPAEETPAPAEPADNPAPTAAKLPPDQVDVSVSAGGRGIVKWDGKQVRVPTPGSWIAFQGHGGFPFDEIVIPEEVVADLCRQVGYAVPPTKVDKTSGGTS